MGNIKSYFVQFNSTSTPTMPTRNQIPPVMLPINPMSTPPLLPKRRMGWAEKLIVLALILLLVLVIGLVVWTMLS